MSNKTPEYRAQQKRYLIIALIAALVAMAGAAIISKVVDLQQFM